MSEKFVYLMSAKDDDRICSHEGKFDTGPSSFRDAAAAVLADALIQLTRKNTLDENGGSFQTLHIVIERVAP